MKPETLILLGLVAFFVYRSKHPPGYPYPGNIGPVPPGTSGTPTGTGSPGSPSDCPPGTTFNPYNYNINSDTFFNTCDPIFYPL